MNRWPPIPAPRHVTTTILDHPRHVDSHFLRLHINISTHVYHPVQYYYFDLGTNRARLEPYVCFYTSFLYILKHNLHLDYGPWYHTDNNDNGQPATNARTNIASILAGPHTTKLPVQALHRLFHPTTKNWSWLPTTRRSSPDVLSLPKAAAWAKP